MLIILRMYINIWYIADYLIPLYSNSDITQRDMNIANNIKAVAGRHGKTISKIADEMGVAQSHLSRTINNERISLKDLEALADNIGCSVADFFQDEAVTPSAVITIDGKEYDIILREKK